MTDRVAIVGARNASPETLAKVREYVAALPNGTIVISGGAAGVDSAATQEAMARGLQTVEFVPDYKSNALAVMFNGIEKISRRVSGPMLTTASDLPKFRNTYIALSCTNMVAFTEGSYGGTIDAIAQAKRFKRPCEVVR